ncbi:hypothetical protein ACX80N_17000 [Arthrobacter sp. MDT2-16]
MASSTEQATEALELRGVNAPVRQALFEGGVARIILDALPDPEGLQPAGTMQTTSLGLLRLTRHLDRALAVATEQLLRKGQMPARVVVDTQLLAVPPSVNLVVKLDPATLLSGLTGTVISWAMLNDLFATELIHRAAGEPAALGFDIVGGDPSAVLPEQFALAMALRVRQRFGSFAADPAAAGEPHISIAADLSGDVQSWDLAQHEAGLYPVALALPQPEEVLAEILNGDTEDYIRFVDVAPLTTGFRRVTVSANLPLDRSGLLTAVRLRKPANPWRPTPIDDFVVLTAPEDRDTVVLQLSPRESPDVEANAVVRLAHGFPRSSTTFEGPTVISRATTVLLGPDSFPVHFVTVAASTAVLEQATLHGTTTWVDTADSGTLTFHLDLAHPSRSLPLPLNTTAGATQLVAAGPHGQQAVLRGLVAPPEGPVTLSDFPLYGHNAVDVTCNFGPAKAGTQKTEFIPEESIDLPEHRTLLTFGPRTPSQRYIWFSTSVFATGYRFRRINRAGAAEDWSAIQPPDRDLVIEPTDI